MTHCFPHLLDPVRLTRNCCAGVFSFLVKTAESGENAQLHLVADLRESEVSRRLLPLQRYAELDHPEINRVLDCGKMEGLLYVIEATPPGRPLTELIGEAGVSRADMLDIARQIADLSAYAAARHVSVPVDQDSIYRRSDGGIVISAALQIACGREIRPEKMKEWVEEHPAVGIRVGRYELVEKIGEGGFAEVFRARESLVDGEVALKILKFGMDTRQILVRFNRERKMLARMTHAGIASIYDAGMTPSGRPFIVMELVEGRSITDYCNDERLSPELRAALLSNVCRAVEHGHKKGIVHRDLKPSNILVRNKGAEAQPMVIDFGIAKAVGDRPEDGTFFTRTQQFIGSPAYMSPEQVDGLEADQRSDVYSLGAVLYELLTGVPPFREEELREGSLSDMIGSIRKARTQHPADYFAGLSGSEQRKLAEERSTDAGKLGRKLKGSLADVVLKALSKQPCRRYASAKELAADLDSLAEGGKVLARPRWRQQSRVLAGMGLVIAGVFMLGFVLHWFYPLRQRTPTSRTSDGVLEPVTLFQLDGNLESDLPGLPAMEAVGGPVLEFVESRIGSEPAGVLKFPRFAPTQWLRFRNEVGVNGPPLASESNQWTLMMDVRFSSFAGPVALMQCHTENTGPAEVYVGPAGINSNYISFKYGPLTAGTWYRIGIVSDVSDRAQHYSYFVNGTRWGHPEVRGKHSAQYAFDPDEVLLFCDGNGRTGAGELNSLALYDVALTDSEMRALGASTAAGIPRRIQGSARGSTSTEIFRMNKWVTAEDVQDHTEFSMVMSATSSEIWCSAMRDDTAGGDAGAVYRCELNESGRWFVAGKLHPPSDDVRLFGNGIALGRKSAIVTTANQRVYAFSRKEEEDSWNAPVRLDIPAEPAEEITCLLYGENENVIVGAPDPTGGRVFVYEAGNGSGIVVLDAPPGCRGFGRLLAECAVAMRLFVACEDSVRVYERLPSGEAWEEAGRIDPGQGEVLAMDASPSGEMLALSTSKNGEETVHVYEKSQQMWIEAGRVDGRESNTGFGTAVCWLDNRRLLAGAPMAVVEGVKGGAVYVLESAEGMWRIVSTVCAEKDCEGGRFGTSITIAGESIAVGAPHDHHRADHGGTMHYSSRDSLIKSLSRSQAKEKAASGSSGQ